MAVTFIVKSTFPRAGFIPISLRGRAISVAGVAGLGRTPGPGSGVRVARFSSEGVVLGTSRFWDSSRSAARAGRPTFSQICRARHLGSLLFLPYAGGRTLSWLKIGW
jgi:hypothetical protein